MASPTIDKFVVGMDQFGNESFDPFAQGTPGKPYLEGLFDHLVGVNKAGTAVSMASGLADGWTVSADGLSITFHLRSANFSNNTPVTSADVSFSLGLNKDPQVGSPYASAVAAIIKSVDTPDDQTVVIHMGNAVSTQLLSLLSPLGGESEGMVVPAGLYKSQGAAAFARAPIGSGPYTLSGYKAGQEIDETARTDYWGGTPMIHELVFQLITDDSARLNALKTGQVDFISTSRDQLAALQTAGFKPYVKAAGDQLLLFTPWDGKTHDPIMSNPKVRQALSLAINRDELNKTLFAGVGKPSGNYNTSAAFGYQPIPPDSYDVSQAKQLLTDAGIAPGQMNIDIEAFTSPGWPESQRVAEAISGYWQAIGVQSHITFQTFPAFRQKWVGRTMHGQVMVLEPLPASVLPSGLMTITLTCAGAVSVGCDPTVDADIAAMNAASNDQALATAIAKAEQDAATQRMYIGLLEVGTAYVGDAKVPADYSPGVMYESFNTKALAGLGK